jgi:murein L,D-transpeptidase YcbB/YkuD
MNITAAERVETIRLNMARWRWQAHDLGSKYVLVNIASFNLKAYQDMGEKLMLDIPVIVGKEQHQTPVFSDSIKYIEINPFWNITRSIAMDEELPELQKNPHHLVERHVRLFSSWQEDAVELNSTTINWLNVTKDQIAAYRLRQDPGPWNALGKIKFVFPNLHSIYMHDTPAQNLFTRTQRDFSHGCIRVSDPLSLAIYALDGQRGGWNDEKLKEVYVQDSRKVIWLSSPIPVHITYQTTWVDKDGTIYFNRDIYLRDTRLQNAL